MSFLYFIILIFLFPLYSFIFGFVPYYTRKTECFGISIPEKEYFNQTLKHYRKKFAILNIVIGFALFCTFIVWYLFSKESCSFTIWALFLQLIIGLFIYLHYHNLVKLLKEKSDWKNDVVSAVAIDLSNNSNDYISSVWLLLFPIMIAATIILGFVFYNNMPLHVPIHYDINGQVNGYAQKSYALIFFIPIIQLFMSATFTFVFFMMKSRRRRIDPTNEEESRRKYNIFRKSMGMFSLIEGSLTLFLFACIQLSMLCLINATLMITLTAIIMVLLGALEIWIGVKVGQGGSRVKNKKTAATEKLNLKDSDSYWKLGIFYCNPNDPTLFVEKRFGIGYTVNFGRPASYLIISAIILIAVLSIVMSNFIKK